VATVIKELSARSHTITIRMSAEKNPESTGHACRIVHSLVNGMKQQSEE
jgi:hypothetical protein